MVLGRTSVAFFGAALFNIALLGSLFGCSSPGEATVDAAPPTDGASDGLDGSLGCLGSIEEPMDMQRVMNSWPSRPYDLRLPSSYDCTKPTPTILVFHGGGSNKNMMPALTCPDGNLSDPACLDAIAEREGIALVYVNGTGNPFFPNLIRTFRAGGCPEPRTVDCPWACVSGHACEEGIDDLGFFDDLWTDLANLYHMDPKRVFATGISNGAAMSHTLACVRPDKIAAIAPIAGGNQRSSFESCSPTRTIPVLSFHGDADQGWPYRGGESSNPDIDGTYMAVDHTDVANLPEQRSTIGEWASRNGCEASPIATNLPDTEADGTTATRYDFTGCDGGGDVASVVIAGGGHTWPGGSSPIDLGLISRDVIANELMAEFFLAHPLP